VGKTLTCWSKPWVLFWHAPIGDSARGCSEGHARDRHMTKRCRLAEEREPSAVLNSGVRKGIKSEKRKKKVGNVRTSLNSEIIKERNCGKFDGAQKVAQGRRRQGRVLGIHSPRKDSSRPSLQKPKGKNWRGRLGKYLGEGSMRQKRHKAFWGWELSCAKTISEGSAEEDHQEGEVTEAGTKSLPVGGSTTGTGGGGNQAGTRTLLH